MASRNIRISIYCNQKHSHSNDDIEDLHSHTIAELDISQRINSYSNKLSYSYSMVETEKLLYVSLTL